MELDCTPVLSDDRDFRIPTGREHHYGCLKPFRDPWLSSHVRNEDTKSLELLSGSAEDLLPSLFKVCPLFRGPPPSMLYLFSNTLLHSGDV